MVSPIGSQIFGKHTSHLENLSASRVSKSTFHTENPEILGTKSQNLITWETWHPGLVYSWPYNSGKPFCGHYQEANHYTLQLQQITLLFHKYFNVCHQKHEHITVCLEHNSASADTFDV